MKNLTFTLLLFTLFFLWIANPTNKDAIDTILINHQYLPDDVFGQKYKLCRENHLIMSEYQLSCLSGSNKGRTYSFIGYSGKVYINRLVLMDSGQSEQEEEVQRNSEPIFVECKEIQFKRTSSVSVSELDP